MHGLLFFGANSGGGGAGSAIITIIYLIVVVVEIAAMWMVFQKAGRPGWAAIIPIYNTLQLVWLAGKPWWWIILFCIPVVNIVFDILLFNEVSKRFGHGTGFTVGLILLPVIFIPILGFGDSRYQGAQPAFSAA